MISRSSLEEVVLCLLAYSTNEPEVTSIALQVTPALFSTRTNRIIAETALTYIAKYQAAPRAALDYLLEAEMRRGEEGKLIAQTLKTARRAGKAAFTTLCSELSERLS